MSGPRSHCDLSSENEREEDIYRLGGDDLYRFCIPRGDGAA